MAKYKIYSGPADQWPPNELVFESDSFADLESVLELAEEEILADQITVNDQVILGFDELYCGDFE